MTWSERFAKYVDKKFGGNQLEAAFSLHVAPSRINDWVRGTTPRDETQQRIAKWSGGDVPAEERVSAPQLAKSHPRARRKATGS